MEFPEFELFLRPDSASFLEGEQRLILKAESAIPDLKAFFTAEARNEFDVPYCRLGNAMRCALETVRRLGPIRKELKRFSLGRKLISIDNKGHESLLQAR